MTEIGDPLFLVSPLGFPSHSLVPVFCVLVILLETQDSFWNFIHPYFCTAPHGWGYSGVKAEREKGEKNNGISPHSLNHRSLFLNSSGHRETDFFLGF